MKRVSAIPRPNWQSQLDQIGFEYHSIDEQGNDMRSLNHNTFYYWREDVAYEFTERQIESLYDATKQVHDMSMVLVGDLIKSGNLPRLNIERDVIAEIERSWRAGDRHFYGRFDFTVTPDGVYKAMEYNADTPTSLLESSLAQWYWKEAVKPKADQFNSIHEAMVDRFDDLIGPKKRHIHLTGFQDSFEDWGNLQYLAEVFEATGCTTSLIDVADIGITAENEFIDLENRIMETIFKLYPWEWFADAPYFRYIKNATFFEPVWKMVISNKAFMALLWERFPNHPNLLKTFFTAQPLRSEGLPIVCKPFLSREGANIAFYDNLGKLVKSTPGDYGKGSFVYQEQCLLPSFAAPETTGHLGPQEKMYAVLGSWVVGDEPVGLDIREDVSEVTKDTSYFVPHYFIG